MRLHRNSHVYAGLLVMGLALIGGTGCLTTAAIMNRQDAARRRDYEAQFSRDYKQAAEKGDLAAKTLLGLDYLNSRATVSQYGPKGISLLEEAAAARYAPAELALGLLLTKQTGNLQPTGEDALRGVALLKSAASRACFYESVSAFFYRLSNPTMVLEKIYRSGALVANDPVQADLWRARDILHCGGNSMSLQRLSSKNAADHDETEKLAWLQLFPANVVWRNEAIKLLTQANVAAANRRAAQLRQAVADSEREYPSPTTMRFSIKVGQSQ